MPRLALVPGLGNTSAAFKAALVAVARRVGTDPSFLAAVISFETIETFSPSIPNGAGSGAVGLIQFLPSRARSLGTSAQALAAMSAVDQLAYVEKYLRPFAGRISSLENLYLAIFAGVTGKAPSDVLYAKGSDAYEKNKALDFNGDGTITAAEATTGPRSKLNMARGFVDVIEGAAPDSVDPLSSPPPPGGSGGDSSAASPDPVWWTVRAGESLSSIARYVTGSGLRWPDLYQMPENRRTIGPNPNKIRPGQRLKIPTSWGRPRPPLDEHGPKSAQ